MFGSTRDNCSKLSISIFPLRCCSIEPPLPVRSVLSWVPPSAAIIRDIGARSRTFSSGRLASALALVGRVLELDAVHPLGAGLLRHQRKAELLAHHARKEPAHRVRLPTRCFDDCGDSAAL